MLTILSLYSLIMFFCHWKPQRTEVNFWFIITFDQDDLYLPLQTNYGQLWLKWQILPTNDVKTKQFILIYSGKRYMTICNAIHDNILHILLINWEYLINVQYYEACINDTLIMPIEITKLVTVKNILHKSETFKNI